MAEEEQVTQEKQVAVQKIYAKDFSFESPRTPHIFQDTEWNPKTNLNLRSSHEHVADNIYEVVLTLTIEAKKDEDVIFLIELQQAGLFLIAGYDEAELKAVIGSFCPNILFPFARETIHSTVAKGGFPEFLLQPINFDALYAHGLAQAQAEQQADDGSGAAAASNGGGGNGGSH